MQFESRFGQAHAAYSAFRPEYPPALFDRILEAVPPKNRRRAMDLGAGTGLSTLPLCRWFAEVVAVEPDPQMAAKLAGLHRNIVVRHTTAEECVQEPNSVDLVACGTAFYWMDGPRVLAHVLDWLRPQGVLAVYRYRFPRTPEAVRAVLRREFELHWDRFRHDRLRDEDFSRRTIAAAPGFGDIQVIWLRHSLQFQPSQLVGFCSSTSYASAYMKTLRDPDAYLKELESFFREAHRNDMIPVDFQLELILARKPQAAREVASRGK